MLCLDVDPLAFSPLRLSAWRCAASRPRAAKKNRRGELSLLRGTRTPSRYRAHMLRSSAANCAEPLSVMVCAVDDAHTEPGEPPPRRGAGRHVRRRRRKCRPGLGSRRVEVEVREEDETDTSALPCGRLMPLAPLLLPPPGRNTERSKSKRPATGCVALLSMPRSDVVCSRGVCSERRRSRGVGKCRALAVGHDT